eukprot:GHVU01138338.1.p1 GENE.GHVU01138338.1~~GHVU01138338.1.p1  ORF type:complete len:249 (-),score=15.08 GHVU01138338.1:855-1601(-)
MNSDHADTRASPSAIEGDTPPNKRASVSADTTKRKPGKPVVTSEGCQNWNDAPSEEELIGLRNRILEVMEKYQIKQTHLCQATGVSPPHMSMFCKGPMQAPLGEKRRTECYNLSLELMKQVDEGLWSWESFRPDKSTATGGRPRKSGSSTQRTLPDADANPTGIASVSGAIGDNHAATRRSARNLPEEVCATGETSATDPGFHRVSVSSARKRGRSGYDRGDDMEGDTTSGRCVCMRACVCVREPVNI